MTSDETKKYKEPEFEPKKKKKIKIEMIANDNRIWVNGEMQWFDPPPYNRDGVFMVPLEVLFKIVFQDEIKRDGNKLTIERSI